LGSPYIFLPKELHTTYWNNILKILKTPSYCYLYQRKEMTAPKDDAGVKKLLFEKKIRGKNVLRT
jgi:hypothetical protein